MGRRGKLYEAWGEKKTLRAWLDDERCHPDLTLTHLKNRFQSGARPLMEYEDLISQPIGHRQRIHKFQGKMRRVKEIAEMTGINIHTLRSRLRKGQTPAEATKKRPGQLKD